MEDEDHYGPALPPGLGGKSEAADNSVKKARIQGPSLPPGMQKSTDSDDMSDEGQLTVKMKSEQYLEFSGQGDDDDDDDSEDGEAFGPMPSHMNKDGGNVAQAAEEFERRAKRMKEKLTVKDEGEEGPSKREEWMMELPPEVGKNFGLQARTFSAKGGTSSSGDGDRSSWTDIPGVKKEKDGKGKKRKRDGDMTSAYDEKMRQQVEEYNKSKRPESLMDMHSKKLKKKKKKEKKEKKKRKERGEKEEKEERRPFDRDKDLGVNKFDDAQRKSLIKKSQMLNSRFSHGGTTSHFL